MSGLATHSKGKGSTKDRQSNKLLEDNVLESCPIPSACLLEKFPLNGFCG